MQVSISGKDLRLVTFQRFQGIQPGISGKDLRQRFKASISGKNSWQRMQARILSIDFRQGFHVSGHTCQAGISGKESSQRFQAIILGWGGQTYQKINKCEVKCLLDIRQGYQALISGKDSRQRFQVRIISQISGKDFRQAQISCQDIKLIFQAGI